MGETSPKFVPTNLSHPRLRTDHGDLIHCDGRRLIPQANCRRRPSTANVIVVAPTRLCRLQHTASLACTERLGSAVRPMSTPTTAVATLPPYHSHPYHPSRAPYSHQQQTTTATDYSSTTANSLLPPASFSRPTRQTQLNSSSNNTAHSSLDGVVAQSRRHQPTSAPQSSHERYDNHISNPRSSPTRIDPNHDNSSTMACSTTTATVAGTDHTFPPAKKRLRSREPNWDEFYRNGRPKEVIVIEDTPEPVANTSRKLAARQPATGAPAAEEASPWRLLKKTKPLDAQQTLRNNNLASDPRTPQQSANHHPSSPSSSSSSLSPSLRDYTNSTLHTTVPSSLQNSQHEQPPSLKRKRASSNHTSETSKRRDVDGLSAFQSYKPPVLPPKKVPDLNVRVVRDVSSTSCFKTILSRSTMLIRSSNITKMSISTMTTVIT